MPQYSVIKFYADTVRDEPVNIGVVLYDQKQNYIKFKFLNDLFKKMSVKDIEIHKQYLDMFISSYYKINSIEEICKLIERKLSPYASSGIIFTEPRGTLAEDPEKEIEELYDRFVEI